MRREELVDLNAFATVAAEQNFTRAAEKLGISQSALSHTIRKLEARLGVRLLTRTTRSVAPTQAGEKLLDTLLPALNAISEQLGAITELSETPAGLIRITTTEIAAQMLLLPALDKILPDHPGIQVEINVSNGLSNIVEERFDAGVRLGEAIEKDMIVTRIGPDARMAVVASPAYFDDRDPPLNPQDLASHVCINLRLTSSSDIYVWEFQKDGRDVRVRVNGQLVFNTASLIIKAAERGRGIAFVMEDHVQAHIADGRLVRVMEDWCQSFSGFHLYYPSRRQPSAAFLVLLNALRYRE